MANVSGSNSAFGSNALSSNTTASGNSAFGSGALTSNTTGVENDAFGNAALRSNTTGGGNSAFGSFALSNNTMGVQNAAVGFNSMYTNTTGNSNSAFGYQALKNDFTSVGNTAIGYQALFDLVSGNSNIAIGAHAGFNLSNGETSNIYIGNSGVTNESGTIRIGDSVFQSQTIIAGISGINVTGSAVMVNSSGRLGVTLSSRRYKQEIADMSDDSNVLMKLRPVSFYYKPVFDDTHTRQYGLVAEEVAKVAPDLVVFDNEGAPQTVRYHIVNAMLLNEVQKQKRLIDDQHQQLTEQQRRIDDLQGQLSKLLTRVKAMESGKK